METILSIVGITCLSAYLLKAYFESTLIVHLVSKITKVKMYTFEDYENYVIFRFPNMLSSLLLCRICLAFHISYLVTALYIACGAKMQLIELITAIGVSSLIGASGAKVINTKVEEKTEKTNKIKEGIKTLTASQDNSKPRDVGGLLIDYSGEKPKFMGYTDFYKQNAEAVFDETKPCESDKCKDYRKRYKKELADMKASFEGKGEKCPECNISSLKRKFYDIMKSEYENNGRPR
jgi:hypothetical protein